MHVVVELPPAHMQALFLAPQRLQHDFGRCTDLLLLRIRSGAAVPFVGKLVGHPLEEVRLFIVERGLGNEVWREPCRVQQPTAAVQEGLFLQPQLRASDSASFEHER